ncbi:Alpha/Beta hydrolase protein [Ephemerocybe angulata]|uniref:Carboxylic ester hydrolase n=1 Tax=Ephemerocybe angulata TaxID=980116 RepID=A0A8H6HGP4_9AGAR|nr:Alpha/Beta hydrolase protein [Tulosesus angulatus]
MLKRLSGVILALLLSVNALSQVKLGKATLVGRDVSGTVEFFGGVPFAEPPLGPLRFEPPVLRTQLPPGTRNASAYGKACVPSTVVIGEPPAFSEDCLFINVYRPTGIASTAKLPVLFWVYGGGFGVGSSNKYDGKDIVSRSVERGTPIIYVNFNYRLGPLGFPQGQEADDRQALNLGVLDHIAALEWVQANIHYFGGDSGKVTIFGQSAGGILAGILFLDPQLGKLARAGIFESGVSNSDTSYAAARNEPVWKMFVEKVPSCAAIASSGHTFPCLKNVTTEEMTAAAIESAFEWNSLPWAPVIDNGPGSVFPGLSIPAHRLSVWNGERVIRSTSVLQEVCLNHHKLYHQFGVRHGSEVPYVYGQPPSTDSTGEAISTIVVDYWISFTVSLNPNDKKGAKRPEWPQFTAKNPALLRLEARNTTVIKDDYRKEPLAFLIKNAFVLRR